MRCECAGSTLSVLPDEKLDSIPRPDKTGRSPERDGAWRSSQYS
jgi:hypothetical protein